MTILAFELSTTQASIAVWQGGAVCFERQFTSERTHNSLIFSVLQEALALGSPDLIVVGTGPGSYAGVRVAISTAIGISLSRGSKLIGLPSTLAASVEMENYGIVGDARRGTWHFALVEAGKLTVPPAAGVADEITSRMRACPWPIFSFDPVPPSIFPEATLALPSASILARLAAALDKGERTRLEALPLEPLYLAQPFITQPKSFNSC